MLLPARPTLITLLGLLFRLTGFCEHKVQASIGSKFPMADCTTDGYLVYLGRIVMLGLAINKMLDSWNAKSVQESQLRDQPIEELSPVIQEFKNLIESDANIWTGFHQMFDQVPQYPPYNNDPVN